MNKPRILFLAPSLSRKMGGIHEIMRGLSHGLSSLGVQVEALGVEDMEWKLDSDGWGAVSARVFPGTGPKSFGYACELKHAMIGSNADLLHLHALWMYPSIAALTWKSQKKRPYIVTPNGMLEPWALRHSGWKKMIAGLIYEKKMLKSAACLQANTEKEMRDFRAYGLKNPVAIIPNGVDLPELGGMLKIENERDVKILLFLGRLHPKKGLENAIRAWSQTKKKSSELLSWQFVIAGWGQAGHQGELEELCREQGLRWEVKNQGSEDGSQRAELIFYGPAFGDEKMKLLRTADAFILPSFSEGFPMAVLEAWAYSLPVLMTPECNLEEGFASDAALRVEATVEGISEGFKELFSMREEDLEAMGARGHELVKNRYSWRTVAARMAEVYEWILGGGSPPECVIHCKR